MNRTRTIAVLLVLLLSCPLLFGCWDRVEVNDLAIVVAASLDKEDDLYRLTIQMPLPGQMGGNSGGGGGTSGEKSYFVDSATGRTAREATANLQKRFSRRLYFAHRRVFVIGEEVAKEGISELFDLIARIPENRLTTRVAVAKGHAYELLNAQPKLERYSGEAIREILESEAVMNVSLKETAQMLAKTGADPIIAYLAAVPVQKGETSKKKDMVQFEGYAQFRDDKMVGLLKGGTAEGITWLRQEFHPYMTTITTDKGEKVTINIYSGTCRVRPKIEKDHLHFDLNIKVKGHVVDSLTMNDFSRPGNSRQAERELEKHIKKSIEECAAKIKEQESDSAGLGLLIASKYPRLWKDKYRSGWYDELKRATFSIQVTTTMSRIGLISENLGKEDDER